MRRLINVLAVILSLTFFFACQNEVKTPQEENTAPITEAVEEVETRTIDPPFENVNVAFNNFKVNSEKGKTLQLDNGTNIVIPENIFVDEQGNPVKGEVDVKYREFHDEADIMASGIPMMKEDGKEYMQSAGMFEIDATQNGKQLKIAEGKTMEVNMASFTPKSDKAQYDFFELDKDASWDNKGTAPAKPNAAKLNALKKLPVAGSKPAKPSKEGDSDKFVFDMNVNYKMFPELRAYHGVVWQYNGSSSKTDPEKNEWVFQTNWKDIKLEAINSAKAQYRLILENGQKRFVTEVKPVLKGQDYEKALANFAKKNEEYAKIKDIRKTETARLNQQADLVRSFKVSNLGIFNWDIWKQAGRLPVLASLDFGQDNKLYQDLDITVYLVGNRRVVAYTPYSLDKFSFNPNEKNSLIAILPKNKIALFSPQDFKAINLDALEKANGQGKHTFTMKASDKTITSVDDLRTLLDEVVL